MHEISESTRYHRFIKGEIRVDGWESDWQKDLKRRSSEDKGKTISAPQIKDRQERVKRVITPPSPRRTCELCTKVIRQESVTGVCREHQPKGEPRVPKAKTICPPCGKPIRKTEYGLCSKCQQKYKYLIHQKALITCDECPRRLHKDNASGKCKAHSRALRTNQLAA